MAEFKVGDLVECIDPDHGLRRGVTYLITDVSIAGYITVEGFPDGGLWQGRFKFANRATNGGNVMSVIKFIKDSVISADEKALRKVGILDESSGLTEEGKEALLLTILPDYWASLVETAKAKIAEDKKEKKC